VLITAFSVPADSEQPGTWCPALMKANILKLQLIKDPNFCPRIKMMLKANIFVKKII